MRLTGVAILLLPAMLSAAEPQRWCEASIDVRHALNGLEMPDLKGPEREQAQKERFQGLLGKYPDDVFVNLRYQRLFRGHTQAERQAVIDHYRKLVELHPGEALYQFLYAEALLDIDTPRSIQLAETIISTHPDFARAHLLLAAVYSWGKFIDRQKTRLHLDSFFEACPATLDSQALALAQRYGGAELAAKLIPGLRTRCLPKPIRINSKNGRPFGISNSKRAR
jgi:predicted Zn-dependent protease